LEVNTFAYVNRIITFAIIPFTAITQAASPIIGYNIGAKQLRRVSSSILWSFLYATVYATLAIIILYLCSGKILSLLTDDIEIIHHGIDMLKYLSPAVLFIPFSLIIGATYQASGKRSLSFLLAALPLLLLIPSSLVLQKLFETRGAWLSFTVSNALSGLIAIVISLRTMSTLIRGKSI
jgi:Na+-driven multidrug efflux pump